MLAMRLWRTAPSVLRRVPVRLPQGCAQERFRRGQKMLYGPVVQLPHTRHGGKAVPGASVRRPSWDPAVETSVVAGHPLGSRPLRRTVRNRMLLIHTFAECLTGSLIRYRFALGVGAGRNVAPGKRVELPSGRNCFLGSCVGTAWTTGFYFAKRSTPLVPFPNQR